MPNLGTYDPPVSLDQLKAARSACLLAPVTDSQGRTFQFDRDDEKTMEEALLALEADTSLTVNWRLLDNTEIPVDHTTLPEVLADLRLKRAQRGVGIDQEYMQYRSQGITQSQLQAWLQGYGAELV